MIERVIVDVDARKVVRLKMPPDQHRSSLCDDLSCAGGHGWDDVQWSADSTHLAFVSTSRDHKQEWLRVADAATGDVREVMNEKVATYFESGNDKSENWRYLSRSNEVLWFSERDNWGQLYLYDAATGKLKNQITHGDGNVTQVLHVDEKARVIYFLAVGKEAGRDPYFAALYRVNFDGTGHEAADAGGCDPRRDRVAGWARVCGCGFDADDAADDGGARRRRQRGDGRGAAGHLEAARDWMEAADADHGEGARRQDRSLWIPVQADELRCGEAVSHRRPCLSRAADGFVRRAAASAAAHKDMQSLAELGFVVVCIDGMGTPDRSKSFHDALYGDMADNTIPDQVAGIKELAAKYPWIDAERVGIYGHSGGGAATAAAMFHFPDFFKVGISESGNHDNRVYEDDWAEKWIGLLKKNADGTTNYDSQANENFAKNLKGHLLLMHGTMDDNVPPNNTLLVVDALIKANKDFDLLMIPNANHGYGAATPYVTRRRWDYFVRYLAGGVPPVEYQMKPWDEQQAALAQSVGQSMTEAVRAMMLWRFLTGVRIACRSLASVGLGLLRVRSRRRIGDEMDRRRCPETSQPPVVSSSVTSALCGPESSLPTCGNARWMECSVAHEAGCSTL